MTIGKTVFFVSIYVIITFVIIMVILLLWQSLTLARWYCGIKKFFKNAPKKIMNRKMAEKVVISNSNKVKEIKDKINAIESQSLSGNEEMGIERAFVKYFNKRKRVHVDTLLRKLGREIDNQEEFLREIKKLRNFQKEILYMVVIETKGIPTKDTIDYLRQHHNPIISEIILQLIDDWGKKGIDLFCRDYLDIIGNLMRSLRGQFQELRMDFSNEFIDRFSEFIENPERGWLESENLFETVSINTFNDVEKIKDFKNAEDIIIESMNGLLDGFIKNKGSFRLLMKVLEADPRFKEVFEEIDDRHNRLGVDSSERFRAQEKIKKLINTEPKGKINKTEKDKILEELEKKKDDRKKTFFKGSSSSDPKCIKVVTKNLCVEDTPEDDINYFIKNTWRLNKPGSIKKAIEIIDILANRRYHSEQLLKILEKKREELDNELNLNK